jgi:hypothetical protein
MRSVEVRAFFGSNSGSTATASEFYSFKVQVCVPGVVVVLHVRLAVYHQFFCVIF